MKKTIKLLTFLMLIFMVTLNLSSCNEVTKAEQVASVPIYIMTFETEDGNIIAKKYFYENERISFDGYIPSSEKDNFGFSGWTVTEPHTSKAARIYSKDEELPIAKGDYTIITNYDEVHRLTLLVDGTTYFETADVVDAIIDYQGKSLRPTKAGYIFSGWKVKTYSDSANIEQVVDLINSSGKTLTKIANSSLILEATFELA